MRTLIRNLALLLLLSIPASSCMQHNGDIGEFFGTWKLTSLTVDGNEDPAYNQNVFFQFQTSVIRIVKVEPHQLFSHHLGQWSRQDQTLCLDFGFTADAPGEYEAPQYLYLENGKNMLHIVKLSSRNMELTLGLENGTTVRYRLKKQ